MVRLRYSVFFSIMVILGMVTTSRSENLISYRVNTNSGSDWNVLVNDVPIVRHRPTGFGRCIYSGNINKAVTNGMNLISLTRVGTSLPAQVPAGFFSIEINVFPDYRGQSDISSMETILRYSGSETTNLLFNVSGEISVLKEASVGRSPAPRPLGPVFYFIGIVYLVFINFYGFSMVLKDRQSVKLRQPRTPKMSFIWNSIYGGSLGLLIGIFLKRYNDDKTLRVWIGLILITQIFALAFLLSPSGRETIVNIKLPKRQAFFKGSSDWAVKFFNSAAPAKAGDLPN